MLMLMQCPSCTYTCNPTFFSCHADAIHAFAYQPERLSIHKLLSHSINHSGDDKTFTCTTTSSPYCEPAGYTHRNDFHPLVPPPYNHPTPPLSPSYLPSLVLEEKDADLCISAPISLTTLLTAGSHSAMPPGDAGFAKTSFMMSGLMSVYFPS